MGQINRSVVAMNKKKRKWNEKDNSDIVGNDTVLFGNIDMKHPHIMLLGYIEEVELLIIQTHKNSKVLI